MTVVLNIEVKNINENLMRNMNLDILNIYIYKTKKQYEFFE